MKKYFCLSVLLICISLIACGKKITDSPTLSPQNSEDGKKGEVPTLTPTLPPNFIYRQNSDGTYSVVKVERIDAKSVFPKGEGNFMYDYKIDDSTFFNQTEVLWMLDSKIDVRFPSYDEAESSLAEYPLSELSKRDTFGLVHDAKSFLITSGVNYGTIKNDLKSGNRPQFVKTNKGRGYFVYRFEDGYRLFKFFYMDSFGNIQYTGYPILVKKNLCLSDFMNIKIGDTIDDVAQIDPVAAIYKQIYDQYPDSSLVLEKDEELSLKLRIFTCHLCKDCAIEYIYTRDADGQYKITDMWKDGQFNLYTGDISASWSFSAKIFPEDYPNEQ